MEYLDPEVRRGNFIKKLILIMLVVDITYLILFFVFDFGGISFKTLSLFFVIPLVLYVLVGLKKMELAKVVGLFSCNICLFLVSSSESTNTGVYLHFVSLSAAAIALFSYDERWKGFSFMSISMILLLLVNITSFDILPFREHTKMEATSFFVIHTITGTFMCAYSMYMILSMNNDAERYLHHKQVTIEKQNEELKKTNEELDRFVYSASHDLRAPLSNIKGLANLMMIDPVTPKEEFIKRIENSANQMEKFIRDIEHYSRNSRIELTIEPLDLHSLINDIIKSLSHFDNALNVSIENEVASGSIIWADSYRLRVILNNLITNAIKYADLSKERPYVKISLTHESEYYHIKIMDNGIGIKEEHVQKVFDMFYRASSTSKGSGLGLYIVKESVDKMKGQINVQSEYGKGSVFSLKIKNPYAVRHVPQGMSNFR
jgi:signal transduction histidine kinase